jgi:putative membrane protein
MKRFAISIGCALMTTLPIASAIGKDQSPEDQTIVNEASRGGIMEVKLGELAERNGLSSEVKEFGAHMVKDHTRLNKELGAAATSIGLTVPTDLSGKNFDKEYTDLMVKDHIKDLAAFKKAESTTQDPKPKTAISRAIPVIQEHLSMAR